MPYTITLTNGTVLTTVADATVDETTNMFLIGRNYAGYGGFVAENFVHLLENAANTSAPPAPLTGQLWYNTTTSNMEVWDGTVWVSIGFPADGLSTTNIGVTGASLIIQNEACPANERTWRINVSNTSPYIGMLVFQALNDDGSVRNTVMALDGVNNLIIGQATYS